MTGFVDITKPNLPDYLTFIRQHVGISSGPLPDNSMWISATFNMALETVNELLALAGSVFYTLSVYNLGADRLLNFALDEAGQTYFSDLRKTLGISGFTAGVITSSSDQGTSQSIDATKASENLTMGDLQMLKTPYGRQYLAFAQMYGPTVWGLT